MTNGMPCFVTTKHKEATLSTSQVQQHLSAPICWQMLTSLAVAPSDCAQALLCFCYGKRD